MSSSSSSPTRVVDAHLHIWPSPKDFTYDESKIPTVLPGDLEDLFQNFIESNVQGAMIVQPINLGFDHAFVSDALLRNPGKFVGCALANPANPTQLAQLLTPNGRFQGARFNPGLWSEGERMDNAIGREMFRLCGERNAFVGFMCYHGLHLSLDAITNLCTDFPETKVFIDHFGFCKTVNDANWKALLDLARFPAVHVKISAQFRISDDYPYNSSMEQLKQLIDAYGATRLVWGSDYPYVKEKPRGYQGAAELLTTELYSTMFSKADVALIRGGNMERMFPNVFH